MSSQALSDNKNKLVFVAVNQHPFIVTYMLIATPFSDNDLEKYLYEEVQQNPVSSYNM